MNRTMQRRNLKVILSGGGTGGHIFPAVAIADAIRQKVPDTEFLFIGAKNRMEMQKVPDAGYPIEGLWISGFNRNLSLSNLSFPMKLVSSMIRARSIIKKFKPDVVIGTGGFASGPTLRMAAASGIPTLIQEQNSYPGITNRLLSNKVNKICVSYDGMERYFPKDKIIITGNPVRKELLVKQPAQREAREVFNLDPRKPVILIVGGSQGARGINLAIRSGLKKLEKAGIQLIWQTGKHFYQEAANEINESNCENIKVLDFIKEMNMAYSAADAVISRAGAIAISELCIIGKPALFVPLPTAAEDHQTKNAMALVEKDAAILVKNDRAQEELVDKMIELINNKELRERLSSNISGLAKPEATETIANEVLKLV